MYLSAKHTSLHSLTVMFASKRFRPTPLTSLEPIMYRFVELCVDMRKGRPPRIFLRTRAFRVPSLLSPDLFHPQIRRSGRRRKRLPLSRLSMSMILKLAKHQKVSYLVQLNARLEVIYQVSFQCNLMWHSFNSLSSPSKLQQAFKFCLKINGKSSSVAYARHSVSISQMF